MKIIKLIFLIYLININILAHANEKEFNKWLVSFKVEAMNNGISENTVNNIMNKAKFLPKVIKYDRYQPEFYEDTKTYITKRSNTKKVKNGKSIYIENKEIINTIEKNFNVEKELLLALMGIETNFGKYLGKMDLVSSLATLSYDKRRSKFFTNELLTLLKLIDNKILYSNSLYGSWAGAFGNFQFMPTTIDDYAIDFDDDSSIKLTEIKDSFASAANYINSIGWKKNQPCFLRVKLKENIPDKYLNTSAKKITNKKKIKYFKKYILDNDSIELNNNIVVGIITPDKDIIPDSQNLTPAYLIFDNYELILKWNRSLRFALAVCTLKDRFKNEL